MGMYPPLNVQATKAHTAGFNQQADGIFKPVDIAARVRLHATHGDFFILHVRRCCVVPLSAQALVFERCQQGASVPFFGRLG